MSYIRSDVAELKAMIKGANLPLLHDNVKSIQEEVVNNRWQLSDFLGMYAENMARKKARRLLVFNEPLHRSPAKFENLSQIAAFLFLDSEQSGKVIAMLAAAGDGSLSNQDLLEESLIRTLYPLIFKQENVKKVVAKCLNQVSSKLKEVGSTAEDSLQHIVRGLLYLNQKNKTWGEVFECLVQARNSLLPREVKEELEEIWFTLDDLFYVIEYVKVDDKLEIENLKKTIPLESSAAFMCFVFYSAQVLRTTLEIDMRGYASVEDDSLFSVQFAESKYESTEKVLTKAKSQVRVTSRVYRVMVKAVLPQLGFRYHAYIFSWMLKEPPSQYHEGIDGIVTLISSSEE